LIARGDASSAFYEGYFEKRGIQAERIDEHEEKRLGPKFEFEIPQERPLAAALGQQTTESLTRAERKIVARTREDLAKWLEEESEAFEGDIERLKNYRRYGERWQALLRRVKWYRDSIATLIAETSERELLSENELKQFTVAVEMLRRTIADVTAVVDNNHNWEMNQAGLPSFERTVDKGFLERLSGRYERDVERQMLVDEIELMSKEPWMPGYVSRLEEILRVDLEKAYFAGDEQLFIMVIEALNKVARVKSGDAYSENAIRAREIIEQEGDRIQALSQRSRADRFMVHNGELVTVENIEESFLITFHLKIYRKLNSTKKGPKNYARK